MKNTKRYLLITALIFLVIAALHLLRLINHWEARMGNCDIPLWISWLGLGVAGFLSAWAFRLYSE